MVTIPNIIMQTWKTEELPEKWKPSQDSIRKYMPDWKYILMTDEMNREFIQNHFPDFLSYYDAFPYPIQRADAIRYAWLYVHGGLYIDCDFELLAPLDELFTEDYDLFLVPSANLSSFVTNEFMASKPGNKLWLDMIEEMKAPAGFSAIDKHLAVMNTTGPVALTRVVNRTNPPHKKLPNEKIKPYTICDKEFNKEGTLLKPLEGSSWVSGTGTIYQWCYCQAKYLFAFVFILIVALCLILIYYYH
jgi:inositol phosphorylceramide mannosyltransferase catalytic subunit